MKTTIVIFLLLFIVSLGGEKISAQDKKLKTVYIDYRQFMPKSLNGTPLFPECQGSLVCCTTCENGQTHICIINYPSSCSCNRFPNYAVAIYCDPPCYDAWMYCDES
ncbi:MAG: hypothetical protein WCW35_08545 [Bacteroidota bacterium]|jgi:hypothetical protein